MRLSYYPGCSLTGTSREYDHSIRQVARLLEIELAELSDWSCCGASSAHMSDADLAHQLAVRNLQLARSQGLDLLVPCAACFQRLRCAELTERHKENHRSEPEMGPLIRVIHLTTLLSRPEMLKNIKELTARPLDDLPLACYYGCLSLRPPRVTGAAEYENPRGLDAMMAAVGAKPVSWSHKTECCSGSLTMARPDIASTLVGDIVRAAKRAGALALVVDCPMCHANLESRQERQSPLPVFFATELVALALSGKSAGKQWRKHLIDPRPLLTSVGF